MAGANDSKKKTGLYEMLIFLAAIISGTACSICSKTMMQLHGVGIDGTVEQFSKPIFQTFGMFIGMTFGLVMHAAVLYWEIPFPGYDHEPIETTVATTTTTTTTTVANRKNGTQNYGSIAKEKDPLVPMDTTKNGESSKKGTPLWMYFFLVIPSIFDIGATALCMMGLQHLDVSIYQLLRGSGIIFVALMKQHVLGDHLYKFQWIGVFWNVISVILVGGTAILNSNEDEEVDAGLALLGVTLVMLGAFVQALQFVFEEKVMTLEEAAAPPLLLIGMEGLWGTVICLILVYPLAYFLPGDDHGSYEDPFNTYEMFMNTETIQWAFVIYFFAIFCYNFFAVMVTFALSSIWHAILDNFRPITVWLTDLAIYYLISMGAFGAPWTKFSIIQLFGMFVLLYGTAIYNAPNAGSIRLEGQWWAFGLNMEKEYNEIEIEMQEEEMDAEWQAKLDNFQTRRRSSLAERSPHISVHTQALRGLASSKI